MSLSDQFLHFAKNLLSPASNAELQEATKWIENFRKTPDSTTILMQLVNRSNITEMEGIFATHTLKWTAFRAPLCGDGAKDMIDHMLHVCPSSIGPSLRNIGYIIAILVIRSYLINVAGIEGSAVVSDTFESFSDHMTIELAVNILKFLPEISHSRILYRGPKDQVDSCIRNIKLTLLRDVSPVIATVRDCLHGIVHPASGTEFIISPGNVDVCEDALCVIVEWTHLLEQTRSESGAIDVLGDAWVDSGVVELVAAVMSSYISPMRDNDDGDQCRIICEHITLYQRCGEVICRFQICCIYITSIIHRASITCWVWSIAHQTPRALHYHRYAVQSVFLLCRFSELYWHHSGSWSAL
jgi:hypothetical protein